VLVRHGRSDYNDARRLNGDPAVPVRLDATGVAQARALRDRLEGVPIDLAVHTRFGRTRETLAGLLSHFDNDLDIRMTRDLYESGRGQYLDVIRTFGSTARQLLVIGHNPAMQEVAVDLVGAGNPVLIEAIAGDYPTAALAVIDFPEKKWSEIAPRGGRIVAFFRPRELEVVEPDGSVDE